MSIIGNKSTQSQVLYRYDDENNLRLKPTARSSNATLAHQNKTKSSKKKNGGHKTSNDFVSKTPNDKQKPKKSLVRNPELPMVGSSVITVRKGILKNPLISACENPELKVEEPLDISYCKSRLSSPELHSSLNSVKKISATKREKVKPPKVLSENKQMIGEKAGHKLNFQLEEQIYRDLVALNVTDEDLLKEAEKHPTREIETTRRDTELKLEDIFVPKSGVEYDSISKPLPCSVEKVRRYNGRSIGNKALLWENLAQQ